MVFCLHNLRGKKGGCIQERRKKRKKVRKNEGEADILDTIYCRRVNFEFVTSGNKNLPAYFPRVLKKQHISLLRGKLDDHSISCFLGSFQQQTCLFVRVKKVKVFRYKPGMAVGVPGG